MTDIVESEGKTQQKTYQPSFQRNWIYTEFLHKT